MTWREATRRKLAQRALERQLAYQERKAEHVRGHEDEVIRAMDLPLGLFAGVLPHEIKLCRRRIAVQPPSDLRRLPTPAGDSVAPQRGATVVTSRPRPPSGKAEHPFARARCLSD